MTPPTDIRSLLEQAAAQLKQGNNINAQGLLAQAVMQDPNNSSAWYGLAIAVDDVNKKKDCLKRVLDLKPDHDRARVLLAKLETPNAQEMVLPAETPVLVSPSTIPPVTPLPDVNPAAPQRKQAGASTRVMEHKRRKTALTFGFIGLGIALVILVISFDPKWLPTPVFIGMLLLCVVLPQIVDLFVSRKLKESRRAGRGALAEEKVGELLSGLGPNFEVLHDVECAYGNIDHLVIASNGAVFMIETKSHHGKVTVQDGELLVNGHKPEKDFIAQSLRNSFWLRNQIEPFARKKPDHTALDEIESVRTSRQAFASNFTGISWS